MAVDFAINSSNVLPVPAVAIVAVLCAGGVVRHADGLDEHGKWAFGVVGWSTGPLNRAGRVGWITTAPGTHFDLHGRLRILVWLSIGCCQGSYRDAVDLPHNLVCRPVDGVGLESGLTSCVRVEGTSIIRTRDALSEVICLDLVRITAEPFPVYLVQVIRLQHEAADDASSRRRFGHYLHFAKHDVPF